MMRDDDFERRRQDKRRLAAMLPRARAVLRKEGGHSTKTASGLGEATMAHLREDKLDALVIYPAPLGGWHADVLLKGMPPGVPNSMGSPVGSPLATREEAEEFAFGLLLSVLQLCDEAKRLKQADKIEPIFTLFGGQFRLSPDTYAALLSAHPDASEGYGSIERAIERIEDALSSTLPGVTHDDFKDRWEALEREKQLLLFSIMHIAALSGLYVYPPRMHGRPGDGPGPHIKLGQDG